MSADQVQAVRRRMVAQQVRLLQYHPLLSLMDPDALADCVLAAGGDPVIAVRLFERWLQDLGPRTPDMTADEEHQAIAYIRTHASTFDCDCGTCGGPPHGRRIQHVVPRAKP